jgi:hypothetical protein
VLQAFQAALVNSLPQQLSFIGLPCTCTLLSYQAVPGQTVEAQLKEQTGLQYLLGEAPPNSTGAFATAPSPTCGSTINCSFGQRVVVARETHNVGTMVQILPQTAAQGAGRPWNTTDLTQ